MTTKTQRADDEQLDKFTWDRGDLQLTEIGQGPTLAEMDREHRQEQIRNAVDALKKRAPSK